MTGPLLGGPEVRFSVVVRYANLNGPMRLSVLDPKIRRTGYPTTPKEGGPTKFKAYLLICYGHGLIDIYCSSLENAPLDILMAWHCVCCLEEPFLVHKFSANEVTPFQVASIQTD